MVENFKILMFFQTNSPIIHFKIINFDSKIINFLIVIHYLCLIVMIFSFKAIYLYWFLYDIILLHETIYYLN